MSQATLSKSKFCHGLQCPKWLWLEVYHRELADPVTPELQARFDTGNRVGELARQRYAGGVLIEDNPALHKEGVAQTAAALAHGASILYEAAFTQDNVKIRADVLERLDDGTFALREVKSTGSFQVDKHLADVAVQLHVLRAAGLDVSKATLMHLNQDYVYTGGPYDLFALFAETDVTQEAIEFASQAPSLIAGMMEVLASDEAPEPPYHVDCKEPHGCAFRGYCHADDPDHPVTELPDCPVTSHLRRELDERGILELNGLPDDIVDRLKKIQHLTWKATVEGMTIITPEAVESVASLDFPVHFLDFETVNPGLPLFVGTRPFQTVPTQFSDHVLHEDGTLTHADFLADSRTDPSEELAKALLDALGTKGTVAMYSTYERTVIRRLEAQFPELAGALSAVEGRLFDLANPVKYGCFDPAFHGAYSLKKVVGVLAPDVPAYDDLAVSGGDMAMNAFAEMLDEATPAERKAQIRADLLEYCRQDTLAMVEIYRTLTA